MNNDINKDSQNKQFGQGQTQTTGQDKLHEGVRDQSGQRGQNSPSYSGGNQST
jgi:hypothetical protein